GCGRVRRGRAAGRPGARRSPRPARCRSGWRGSRRSCSTGWSRPSPPRPSASARSRGSPRPARRRGRRRSPRGRGRSHRPRSPGRRSPRPRSSRAAAPWPPRRRRSRGGRGRSRRPRACRRRARRERAGRPAGRARGGARGSPAGRAGRSRLGGRGPRSSCGLLADVDAGVVLVLLPLFGGQLVPGELVLPLPGVDLVGLVLVLLEGVAVAGGLVVVEVLPPGLDLLAGDAVLLLDAVVVLVVIDPGEEVPEALGLVDELV